MLIIRECSVMNLVGWKASVITSTIRKMPKIITCPIRPHIPRASTGQDPEKGANLTSLDNLALDFARGVEAGLSEDEVVLLQMGISREDEMTSVQKQYKTKLVEKLKQRAEELKQKSKECLAFEAGKRAYSKGEYPLACQLLEQGASEHSESGVLGADIRMWLALAYQAVGRTEECTRVYKRLSKYHPIKKIRKQAADLLYILEAPKLKLGEDERVKLPVLKNLDRPMSRQSMIKGRSSMKMKQTKKRELSFEEQFWNSYQPPSIRIPNRYLLAASITLCLLVLWYFNSHN